MTHIDDVIESYDASETRGKRKRRILQWFRQHPGQRVDRMELHSELCSEIDIGQRQLGNYLDALVEDGVLTVHGNQRKAYQLAEEILPPATTQARSALRYLAGVFDIRRWGVAGVLAISTAIWTALTLPFLFLWTLLALVPTQQQFGPITHSELLITAIAMSIWLVVFIALTAIFYQFHRYRVQNSTV